MTDATDTEATAVDTGERTIALPSGNSVTLREWGSLTRGDKRAMLESVRRDQQGSEYRFDQSTGLLKLLVAGWTYQLPLPSVAAGSLDMLPWADDSVLQSAIDPIRDALLSGDTTEAPPDLTEPGPRTVNLPSGNWITLRDWRELTRADKRVVFAEIKGGPGQTSGYDLTNGLLKLLITNWSYGPPIPSAAAPDLDVQPLDALPWGDDPALDAALAPVRRALFPPTPSTPAQQAAAEADPTSPTTPGDA